MLNISISSYGTKHIGNRRLASSNRRRKTNEEDQLIFVGDKKYMLKGFFNDYFKYQRIAQKPILSTYEI